MCLYVLYNYMYENFLDFLFGFLHTNALLKRVYFKRHEFAFFVSTFIHFVVDLFSEEKQNDFDRGTSLENIPISLRNKKLHSSRCDCNFNNILLFFSAWKHMLWVLIGEVLLMNIYNICLFFFLFLYWQAASNVYPQHMIRAEITKYIFLWYHFIWRYINDVCHTKHAKC